MEARIVFDNEAFDRYGELSELGLGSTAIITQILEEVGENINVEQNDDLVEKLNKLDMVTEIVMEGMEFSEEEEAEIETEYSELPDVSQN